MKKHFIFITMLFAYKGLTQSLDSSINSLSHDIARKVSIKNKAKLTLADFVNNEGKTDAVTEYIWRELEEKLINEENIQILERKHLQKLLEENHLQSQGLIDESSVKSAVGFTKIDGMVLGDITYIGNQVKIKITVISIETSGSYAASTSGLISDVAIKKLLEPEAKVCIECKGKGTMQLVTVCSMCKGKGNYYCNDCKGKGIGDGAWFGTTKRCEKCNGHGEYTCKACKGTGKTISYQICPKCTGKMQKNLTSTQSSNSEVNTGVFDICPECMGTGKMKERKQCKTCFGNGSIMRQYEMINCPTCSGRGEVDIVYDCSRCNGTGKL